MSKHKITNVDICVNWTSPEAAIALRQRLNESVEQLDILRKEHTELQVKFETQSRDLTVAKSDCECRLSLFMLILTVHQQ